MGKCPIGDGFFYHAVNPDPAYERISLTREIGEQSRKERTNFRIRVYSPLAVRAFGLRHCQDVFQLPQLENANGIVVGNRAFAFVSGSCSIFVPVWIHEVFRMSLFDGHSV
ncbi:hypothetical protein EBS80_01230 [bacterium]|nr:hypothetical protein [bacterium]